MTRLHHSYKKHSRKGVFFVFSWGLKGWGSWSILDPMETLAKLFGGQARVKIMRLFLLNIDTSFDVEDVVSRSRVTKPNVRKEINALAAMGFVKQKFVTVEGSRGSKKKIPAWYLNTGFQYVNAIRDLLVDPNLLLQEDLVSRF
ncbi:MAG: hypothetical protein RL687_447, partial [Candidatus Parcubacteria bacterium]